MKNITSVTMTAGMAMMAMTMAAMVPVLSELVHFQLQLCPPGMAVQPPSHVPSSEQLTPFARQSAGVAGWESTRVEERVRRRTTKRRREKEVRLRVMVIVVDGERYERTRR